MAEQHIVSNAEIGLTECGRMVLTANPAKPGPFKMGGDDVALWDDDTYLDDYTICGACQKHYFGGMIADSLEETEN